MCGIAGEVRFDGSVADAAAVATMMKSQERRGPDSCGQLMRGRVGLGHQRLKIIDLSLHSSQPMADPSTAASTTIPSCAPNWRGSATRFFSHGDTEVILKAWHAWGPDCVKRFHGMFAFAIAERDSGRVSWRATASASSRSILPIQRHGCASPPACRRWWRPATSTRRSIRWRCTTT
jgi:asparagine synthase (glutamine-hydrolysing)